MTESENIICPNCKAVIAWEGDFPDDCLRCGEPFSGGMAESNAPVAPEMQGSRPAPTAECDAWMQATDPIFRYAFARAEERRANEEIHDRIVGTFSQLARELDEITQAWSHSVKV